MAPTQSTTSTLAAELDALPVAHPELARRLKAAGFTAQRLIRLAETLAAEGANPAAAAERNRIACEVKAPAPDEILVAPTAGTPEGRHLADLGSKAMARGELAFCVMAGGMATRMGGVVKALVEALPGRTFLDCRLAENRTACKQAQRPVPLWLMTSEATHPGVNEALRAAGAPPHVATFMQDLSLRLTLEGNPGRDSAPGEPTLFRTADGEPSPYATGHGDLVDALRRSGLLADFCKSGGRYVWITNLDNLGATVDPAILGAFIASQAEVMAEVTDKANDQGGIPVHAKGRLQVLEEFRLPVGFDPSTVSVFNCNTFLVRADALATVDIPWSWFQVTKKVEGRTAIQFERLIQEITGVLTSTYIRVPRNGATSRFLPVKDPDELARRQPDLEAVARERGLLG